MSPRPPRDFHRCRECGEVSVKWLGRCPGCAEWNTLVAETAARPPRGDARAPVAPASVGLDELASAPCERLVTGVGEIDRVLGGGLVPGALILLGGEPGVGKSTLLLGAAEGLAREAPVLYVAAEESPRQVQRRAQRLGVAASGLRVLGETSLESIEAALEVERPRTVIVDSVQAIRSTELEAPAGTLSQVRETAGRLLPLAKERDITVILVGHVTKEGSLAGPKALEHTVDVVLELEGDRHHAHRILRAVKNRFGPAGELGIFEMTDRGLTEVPDPSALLLSEQPRGMSGSAVTCCCEGTRCLLVEVQALVGPPAGGTPRRAALGVDGGRLAMLLAVLERRAGLSLADRDVFVSAVGGVSLREPAADLALAAALASAALDRPLPADTALFGEIGLAGEIRRVGRASQRLREAGRHGFRGAVIPEAHAGEAHETGVTATPHRSLAAALSELLGPLPTRGARARSTGTGREREA